MRHRLRRNERLLRRDPALLHRKGRDVARGEDVVQANDPAVLINRHEALDRLRDAVNRMALESRQSEDSVCRDRLLGDGSQAAAMRGDRTCTSDQRDVGVAEQLADGVAG